MAQPAGRTFTDSFVARIGASLAGTDAALARRYPGDPGSRQPLHTVYVPADAVTAVTPRQWGDGALTALDAHAPDPTAFAAVLGLADAPLAAEVYDRVRAKLRREPVEDLRIDFEDGYGPRPDAEEDATALAAARVVAELAGQDGAPPWVGIRMKCLEAPVRERGIRTLDLFLTALLDGGLPEGLVVTLPKVTFPAQVAAMAELCAQFEAAAGLPAGRIRFEVQIETTQAILGPDGTATVPLLIGAAPGRVIGLHYGTFDYSAACGVAAGHQAPDHPAADHAKAVMQVAAAGTGVRVSDGSTNVLPVGPAADVHSAWRLHYGLVRRSLARAYYQGWDMHPAQLPTRYAAGYAFYREGLGAAAARLAAYLAKAGGAVLDEPATARALSGFLLRGLDCGALDPSEVEDRSGLDRGALDALAGR